MSNNQNDDEWSRHVKEQQSKEMIVIDTMIESSGKEKVRGRGRKKVKERERKNEIRREKVRYPIFPGKNHLSLLSYNLTIAISPLVLSKHFLFYSFLLSERVKEPF